MIRWNEVKNCNQYFDRNGQEILEGMYMLDDRGHYRLIYATDNYGLGTDATNRTWLKSGRAYSCQFGINGITPYDIEEYTFYKEEVINGTIYLVSLDGNHKVRFLDTENDKMWEYEARELEKKREMEREYRITYADISNIRVMLYEMVEMTDSKEKKKEIFDVITKLCMLKEV